MKNEKRKNLINKCKTIRKMSKKLSEKKNFFTKSIAHTKILLKYFIEYYL